MINEQLFQMKAWFWDPQSFYPELQNASNYKGVSTNIARH